MRTQGDVDITQNLTVSGTVEIETGATVSGTPVSIGENATEWDGAAKTVSTASPSGGSDGDIWLKYTA